MRQSPDFDIRLDTLCQGYDKVTCWVQARAGTIPVGAAGNPSHPIVVLTMQKLLLAGSDVFYELTEMRTDDLGVHWRGPTPHPHTLGRRSEPGGIEVVMCDATPKWHAATGTLLSTGHEARYLGDRLMPEPRPRRPAYAVYDPVKRAWHPWQTMELPDADGAFFSAGAGSAQRVDLANGEILLPLYCRGRDAGLPSRSALPGTGSEAGHSCCFATVARCRFDGKTLAFVEHGNTLTVSEPRGFCEPSLTLFRNRYYLTLRNDVRGYVAVSDDGLHFDDPLAWCFDDGAELGNYNTQQHWVTHADGLFLVYTRRDAANDHVFRHRAPLFIAQVDPERLVVIRDTERILVPEHGARLGNFAVTHVNADETWVTVSEWMQPPGCERFGSDNRVYAARIIWACPNTQD